MTMFSQIIAQNVTRSFVRKSRNTNTAHTWHYEPTLTESAPLPSSDSLCLPCQTVNSANVYASPTSSVIPTELGVYRNGLQMLLYPTQASHTPGASRGLRKKVSRPKFGLTSVLRGHLRCAGWWRWAILVLHPWFCSTGDWSMAAEAVILLRGQCCLPRVILIPLLECCNNHT